MIDETKYTPGEIWVKRNRSRMDHLKERFASLATFIHDGGGWVVSTSGAPTVTLQCLPGSDLPRRLTRMGHRNMTQEGTAERILPHAICENVVIEGSSVPVVRRHAGIVGVEIWSFRI